MWGWRSTRSIVVGLALAVFALTSVAPVVVTMASALDSFGVAFVLDARQRGLLANTLLLGAGAALFATAIGAPLGLVLARGTVPSKAIMRVALAVPVLTPPYVLALACTYLGGRQGLLAGLLGYEWLSGWIYSLPTAILILGLIFSPLVMFATEVALRRVDGRLEEAGLMVAAPRRVLARITLPLAAPIVTAAALMVFVLAVSEFGVPGVLRVPVYTTEVFTAFASFYDAGRAARLAVPLLALCAAVATLATALLGRRLVGVRPETPAPVAMRYPASRWIVATLVAVVAVTTVAPITLLGREALAGRSLGAAFAGSGPAILKSLWLASAGASVVVGVGVALGYARARARARLALVTDALLVVLFATPSTLVGVGLIMTWNQPGPMGLVYGTDGILIMAFLARLLPIAILILAASMRAVSVAQEEAAAACGAGWLRTMAWIVVPQVRLGLMAAWVTVFVLAAGELGVSILVAPPGESTLPIRIYTLIANAPSSAVAALALLQVGVVLMPLVVLVAWLARRDVV